MNFSVDSEKKCIQTNILQCPSTVIWCFVLSRKSQKSSSRLKLSKLLPLYTANILFMLSQPFGDHVCPVNEVIITLGEFTPIRMARTTWMDVILG